MTALPPDWLVEQLPEVMSAHPFSRDFLAIFEDVADTVRARVDNVDHHLDVGLTPPDELGWLASWLAQTVGGLPIHRQRQVIAVAGRELPWRGTIHWLRALLAAYTGAAVEVTDTGGVYLPGDWRPDRRTVTVRLTDTGGLSRHQLQRLIRGELPVDADLDLHLPADGADSPPPPDLAPPAPPEPVEPPSAPPAPVDADAAGWLSPQTGPHPDADDPSVTAELVTAELECDRLTITRHEPLHCRLHLHNRSDQPDQVTIVGVDQSSDWLPDTPLIVALDAGQYRQVPLTVVVPADRFLAADRYTLDVRLTSYRAGSEPKLRRLIVDLTEHP